MILHADTILMIPQFAKITLYPWRKLSDIFHRGNLGVVVLDLDQVRMILQAEAHRSRSERVSIYKMGPFSAHEDLRCQNKLL